MAGAANGKQEVTKLYRRAKRVQLQLRFEMRAIYFVRVAVWSCLAVTLSVPCLIARQGVADDNKRTFAIRTEGRPVRCADLSYYASRRVSFFKPGGIERDGKRYAAILVNVEDEKFAQSFRVSYPSVTEKTIVPLFGYACEVGEVRTDRRPEDGDYDDAGDDGDDGERVRR